MCRVTDVRGVFGKFIPERVCNYSIVRINYGDGARVLGLIVFSPFAPTDGFLGNSTSVEKLKLFGGVPPDSKSCTQLYKIVVDTSTTAAYA